MSEPEFRMPAGPPPLRDRVREVVIDLAVKLSAYGLFEVGKQLLERLLE